MKIKLIFKAVKHKINILNNYLKNALDWKIFNLKNIKNL